MTKHGDSVDRTAEWNALREKYLDESAERPPPDRWEHLRTKLEAAGVPTRSMSGSSMYFTGPDGERLELISDPLLEMYGMTVA